MSEMIERVARVLLGRHPTDKTEASELARAAIAAMREPTPQMIYAGTRVFLSRPENSHGDTDPAGETWRAMNDEALK